MYAFVYELPKNILVSFKGKHIIFHIVAICLTAVFVFSGFDWWYFNHLHGTLISVYLWPAVVLGGLIPILSPLAFFMLGYLKKNPRLVNAGYALAQSAFLGSLISSTYKAFTGRVPPLHHMVAVVSDISHQFQFGFMRGGVFWGWPSSHTTVAFATMVTLNMLYPKHTFLKYITLGYALYVGLGVSMGIHWFSEFVAGMLIGTAIGISVGTSFAHKFLFESK